MFLNLIELKGLESLESFFATLVSWFVLILVNADDNLNVGEWVWYKNARLTCLEKGNACRTVDDKRMNTQWIRFWLTLCPLQFYLHLNDLDVTLYYEADSLKDGREV